MREIVVPLDRSTLAERAVGVARAIADETGASLRLIEIAAPDDVEPATRYLESVADSLLPGSRPVIQVVENGVGDPVAECLLRTVGADTRDILICMSTHGRSGMGMALMGSTAEDVLRRTQRPVFLVGHHCELPWPDHRRVLLVPIDGSGRCDGLLAPIAEIVDRSGLQPILLKLTHSRDVEDAHHPMSGLEEAGQRLVEIGVDAKLVHRFASNIPMALTEAAREWGAAVIVMASFVKPGASRVLMGSVTMRTIHDAPCPVLVYPRMAESLGPDGVAPS